MIQYSFGLYTKKQRQDGTFPLKVKIYRSRTDRILIGLKMYYLPEQWDANRERVVNTVTAALDNARLNNYRLTVGKILLEIDENGETPSMAEIRTRVEIALGQKQPKPATLCAYIESYAAKVPERRTRNNFLITVRKIREFDPIDRSFPEITVGWLRSFEMYYLGKGLKVRGCRDAILCRAIDRPAAST